MSLTNFFKINLPYGIERDEHGNWMAFNREYLPLGNNSKLGKTERIYTNYGKLTDKFLMDLADDPTSVELNDDNEIIKVWFYNDGTNPGNFKEDKPELWHAYFNKLKKLSKKKTK